jgi:hypothetical protein
LLSEKVCALLRNHCAACSGITVRLTPESLCGIDRILQLAEGKKGLDELATTVDDLQKRIIEDDIETTLYLIDPSGEIQDYMNKLEKIYIDQDKIKTSGKRIIELRLKINDFFEKKLMGLK